MNLDNIDLLSTTLYLQFHFIHLFFRQFQNFSFKDLQFFCFLFVLSLRAIPSEINKFWFNLSPFLTFSWNIWCKKKMFFSMLSDCTLKPDSWLSEHVSCSFVSSFFSFSLMFSKWILYVLQALLDEKNHFLIYSKCVVEPGMLLNDLW